METLRRGSRGAVVKQLQELLGRAGLTVMADGLFGVITEEAVKVFQKSRGLTADGIVGKLTWAALEGVQPDKAAATGVQSIGKLKKSKRRIEHIIVHCTASREGQAVTVEDIRRDHKAKGWSDIGYHYVVYLDGSVHAGRNVDVIGAHCSGHNTHSIGIVYVGGVENLPGVAYKDLPVKDTRTAAQKDALWELLVGLRALYPTAEICGHRDFDKGKACPCFDVKKEYMMI